MKFGKKIAQTATEYLIILAVVIIIALIVVGVLGGIPGIGGSSSSNVASAYWQTATIGVDGFKMSASTTSETGDSIIFKNNNPVDIEIINISLGSVEILSTTAANITILKGRTKTVENVTYTALTTGDYVTCTTAGDAFSETLVVQYKDKKTNAEYTFTSDQKLEGECAA